ncbi:hypothetical protein DHEL01_v207912 [Diaporthe helianthi]|uniref:Uncharacterized protein n=1 Tax=Diaporthe helianthi TaxID=158607 RepID=A0A2P5HTV5_DIAHE|nr:hypothetical protein DHEL01_v207912 [Diaporthe helianthi]
MHNDGLDALKLHLSSLCVIVSQRTAAMCTPSADTAVQSEPRQYHLELRGGAAKVGHHRSVAGPQRIHYSPGERQAVLTRHERPIGATIRATASGRPARSRAPGTKGGSTFCDPRLEVFLDAWETR